MNMKIIGGFATTVMLIGGLSLAQTEEVKSKAARPAAKKSDRSSREAIISRFDKDGDGKLSGDERRAAAESRKKLASRDNAERSDNDRRDQGARERYAAVAKRISEGVKAGKITEEQGRERLAAFRKNMAEGRRDSDSARPSREEITKRFDNNGDGKLDEKEREAARKALSSRRSQGRGGSERGERSRSGERRERGAQTSRRGSNRRGGENTERSRNRDSDRIPRGQDGENAERRRRGSQRDEGRENRRRGNRRGGE
jgi:hypothetical protein|tara:strand:+ start:1284 stop:2054 length:771 start_codon:yes stop_codon:yes gene_type:complete